MTEILLGSVALEPNRWRTLDPSGAATTRLSEWMDATASAGFDGLEVWDRHLTAAGPDEAAAILASPLPIPVFNSYASLDGADSKARTDVANWVHRSGSRGVKFNVGNDPTAQHAYAERIAQWIAELPDDTALLCECHHGISIAEDPRVARAIFDVAGPPKRLQAIVHTHEEPDAIRERFDQYGDRITHVHVNFLDFEKGGAPRLSETRALLESQASLLLELGFRGSYTLEFVHGLLTPNDEPGYLMDRAAEDLLVLRDVLA